MRVDFVVDNEKEFIEREMDLFGMAASQYMTFSIHVISTGITYYYETEYNKDTDSWLVVTI